MLSTEYAGTISLPRFAKTCAIRVRPLAASGRGRPHCTRQLNSTSNQQLTALSTCCKHYGSKFPACNLNQNNKKQFCPDLSAPPCMMLIPIARFDWSIRTSDRAGTSWDEVLCQYTWRPGREGGGGDDSHVCRTEPMFDARVPLWTIAVWCERRQTGRRAGRVRIPRQQRPSNNRKAGPAWYDTLIHDRTVMCHIIIPAVFISPHCSFFSSFSARQFDKFSP